ncbi:hypothetical protein [Kocuria rosea]|uniref:hypothetical protein n=1 Tax=Kocuria rosea TaxID=1275 RepID=UPI0011A396AE|nr:hypothetical protein [Kocuria rosea]
MSNDEQSKLDAYAEDLQGRWTAVDEDPDDTDEDDIEWLRQPVESNQDFAPFLDAGHPFADRLWALPEDVQERIGAALEPLTETLGTVDEGGEEQDTRESLTVLAVLAVGLPDEFFEGLQREWIAQAVPHWKGMTLEELKRHNAAQLVADCSLGDPAAIRPLGDYTLPDGVHEALWGTEEGPAASDALLSRIERELTPRAAEDALSALEALDAFDDDQDPEGDERRRLVLERLVTMPTEILEGLQQWIMKRAVKEWQEMPLDRLREHDMEELLTRVVGNAKPRPR